MQKYGQQSALVLGCGNSSVGELLHTELGFFDVLNVDFSKAVIEHMSQKNTHTALKFVVGDVCDLGPVVKEGRCFDVAVDKGTLDSIKCCPEWQKWNMELVFVELSRVVKQGGALFLLTRTTPDEWWTSFVQRQGWTIVAQQEVKRQQAEAWFAPDDDYYFYVIEYCCRLPR